MTDRPTEKKWNDHTSENGKKSNKKSWDISDKFTFAAIIVSCLSLLLLAYTIWQNKQFNEKQFALDAVKETKTERFIKAVGRFETIANYKNKKKMTEILHGLYGKSPQTNKNLMLHDLNYILNKYNYINLLYFNKLASRDIIKTAIYEDVKQLRLILIRLPDLAPELDRSGVEDLWNSFRESDYNEVGSSRSKTTE